MNGHDIFAALPAAALSEPWLRQIDRMASSLIRHAAHNTPPSLQERLEEEWMAEMAGRTGRMARLRLALGCCWAAGVIAREWVVSGVAATTPGSSSTAAAYATPGPGFVSPRTAALILIACLHLALIYFLAIGLGNRTVAAIPAFTVTAVPEKPRTQQPPPPPPSVRLAHLPIEMVEPAIPLTPPSDAGPLQGVLVDRPKEPETAPRPRVDRIAGGPGKGFPATADYYPDASRRLGEQGAAAVQVCVDPLGRLTSEPTIIQSSGSTRLDGSARTLARAGSGHYRPTTEDGHAVSACFPFRIRFELATPHDERR
jgi:TonB family protein